MAALPFLNALPGAFIWDDVQLIEENDALRVDRIPSYFREPFLQYYRPVVWSLFTIEKAVAPEPWIFHVTNVGLHAIATLLLFLLLRRWLARWGRSPPMAAAGAALFAVAPIHTEAVSWIAGRGDLLSSVFLLGSCLGFARWREGATSRRSAALSLGCLLVGLFAKETTAVAPVLWLAYALSLPRQRSEGAVTQRSELGFVALGLGLVLAYVAVRSQVVEVACPGAAHLQAAGLTFVATLPAYLGWIIAPIELNAYRMTSLVTSVADVRFIFGLLFCVALTLLAWRHRATRLPIALFLLPLLPVSNLVLPVPRATGGEVPYLAAERWLYLPAAGPATALGVALAAWASRPHGVSRRLAGLALLAVIVAGCARSWVRNAAWSSEAAFYAEHIRLNPRSVVLTHNDGARLLRAVQRGEQPARPLLEAAEARFEQALRENPALSVAETPALINLARARMALGRPQEAVAPLQRYLDAAPAGKGRRVATDLLRRARERAADDTSGGGSASHEVSEP